MPSSRPLFLGIAFLLAACSGGPAGSPSPISAATPGAVATPAPAPNAPWALNLDLTGELSGHVTATVPADATTHNDCTGPDSARLGSWGSTMAFDVGANRYTLFMVVPKYQGAALFTSGVNIEVASSDQAHIWENENGDAVSFTVGADQKTGLLNAVLSNIADTSKKLDVSGHWSCRP